MSVLGFVAVRWLQDQIYSNEKVALLAPETPFLMQPERVRKRDQASEVNSSVGADGGQR